MEPEIVTTENGTPVSSSMGIVSGAQTQVPAAEQTPAATPAATPATPAAAAPATPVIPSVTSEENNPSKPLSVEAPTPVEVKFEPSGNATLDIVNDFLGSVGIGPDDPAYQKAAGGDFADLEAKLKGLGDRAKGYDRYLKAGKHELENIQRDNEAKHGETRKACFQMADEVGGWDSLTAWVRANASEQELSDINQALAAGGIGARETVRYLTDLRKQNPDKQVPNQAPQDPVRPDASTIRGGGGSALSPVQFGKEVALLQEKHGPNYQNTQEYADAVRRRQSYRG